jgi:elongation factor Ts
VKEFVMEISASVVMELREKTGLGMMLCKKALIESNGNMEQAIESLRKQGQAAVAKRAGRVAKQGKIAIVADASGAIAYEVNAETDFVAKNEDFSSFVEVLGKLLLAQKPADVAAAKKLTCKEFSGLTVEGKLTELISKIGENITFKRFIAEKIDPSKERLFSYIHGEGRIGVMVKLTSDKPETLASPAASSLGKDLAMQVAASNPIAIDRETMSKRYADVLEKEKEIYFTQAQTSGKPEKVWPKIVEGKLDKFFKESTLCEQPFIKEPERSVGDRIKDAEKETSSAFTVVSFTRYELGAEEQ